MPDPNFKVDFQNPKTAKQQYAEYKAKKTQSINPLGVSPLALQSLYQQQSGASPTTLGLPGGLSSATGAGGGAGGGAGAGGNAPGYLRTFFGFLGREAMRQAGRTGQPLGKQVLPRIEKGYQAAEADWRRQMLEAERLKAMLGREAALERTGGESQAQEYRRSLDEARQRRQAAMSATMLGTGAVMLPSQY